MVGSATAGAEGAAIQAGAVTLHVHGGRVTGHADGAVGGSDGAPPAADAADPAWADLLPRARATRSRPLLVHSLPNGAGCCMHACIPQQAATAAAQSAAEQSMNSDGAAAPRVCGQQRMACSQHSAWTWCRSLRMRHLNRRTASAAGHARAVPPHSSVSSPEYMGPPGNHWPYMLSHADPHADPAAHQQACTQQAVHLGCPTRCRQLHARCNHGQGAMEAGAECSRIPPGNTAHSKALCLQAEGCMTCCALPWLMGQRHT
jgi:hypothetical protein